MARTPGSGFVTEAMLEAALSGIGTSGSVTSVNGVEPDETGNVEIESLGGVSAEIDPADPTGRTLLLILPSTPSVSLTVTTSGWTATATFAGASPGGLAMTYTVDWGDGTVTSPATSPATRTYAPVAAPYTVTVTVTDSAGGTATASQPINIAPPGLSPFGGQVYADNPSVYFPMNDVGPAIVDYMGNATMSPRDGYDLPTLTARNLGDGDNSTVWGETTGASLGEPDALEGMSHISVEMLVQSSLVTKQGVFLVRREVVGSFSMGPSMSWDATKISWGIGGNGGNISVEHNAPLIADILHVVATYDQQNFVMYINGVEVGRQAHTAALHNAAGTPWLLGRPASSGKPFYGWMGALAIYDHALTPQRVAAHYAATGLGG